MKKYFLFILIMALFSCGGSHDKWNGHRRVKEVYITQKEINIGQETRVDVYFETKQDWDGTPRGLQLVIKLPPELMYSANSSRLYFDNDDRKFLPPSYFEDCPDGSTFMVYELSGRHDLDNEYVDRYDMMFYAFGVASNPSAYISAMAGETVEFACGAPFTSQASGSIAVW